MASRLDNKQQGSGNETIFSISTGQTEVKTNTNQEASSRVDRTRENKGIYLPVQPKGLRDIYMWPQRRFFLFKMQFVS